MKVAEEFLAAQKSSAATGEAEEPSESSESDSEWSMVPTEIYLSPKDTPKRLSLVDLTLGPEVTNRDVADTLVRGMCRSRVVNFKQNNQGPNTSIVAISL